MSDSKTITKRLLSPKFVLSYPHLITPKPFMEHGKPKGDPRYSLTMIVANADLAKFKVEIDGNLVEQDIKLFAMQTAKEQFPELADRDAFKAAFIKGDGKTPTKGWPFHDGNAEAAAMVAKGKEGSERLKDTVIIRATTSEKSPPTLSMYDPDTKKVRILRRESDVDMKLAAGLFVGGNVAGGEFSLRASKNNTGGGEYFISFYVNAVRFLARGEQFGRKGMMDRYDGVYGGESPHDPTQGMSDEIPF